MLGILLKNEWFKVYKKPIFWLLIFFPILWTLLNFSFIYNMSYDDFLMRVESTHKDKDPYNYIFRWYSMLLIYFLPAHYAGIAIYFREQENDKWKKYLSMPINLNVFIVSKLFFLSACMVATIFISFLSLFVSIRILSIVKTDFNFSQFTESYHILAIVMIKVYILSIFLVPLLYILLTKFKNYYIYFILSILLPLASSNINIFSYYKDKGLKSYFLLRKLNTFYFSAIFGNYELISLFIFVVFSIFCIVYINRIKHELC